MSLTHSWQSAFLLAAVAVIAKGAEVPLAFRGRWHGNTEYAVRFASVETGNRVVCLPAGDSYSAPTTMQVDARYINITEMPVAMSPEKKGASVNVLMRFMPVPEEYSTPVVVEGVMLVQYHKLAREPSCAYWRREGNTLTVLWQHGMEVGFTRQCDTYVYLDFLRSDPSMQPSCESADPGIATRAMSVRRFTLVE